MKKSIGSLVLLFQSSKPFSMDPVYGKRKKAMNQTNLSKNENMYRVPGRFELSSRHLSPNRSDTKLNSSRQSESKKPSSVKNKGKSKPNLTNAKPNSRTVAVYALATAAASTYESCSSDGSGAEVGSLSFASRQLEQDRNYQLLDARDRSFAKLLVSTVERRLGQIDKILACCIEKYPPKKGKHSHLIQATLRTGAAQLLFLRTPPFAAIKETVQVLRIYHRATPSNNPPVPEAMIKFVNGVFRKLSGPATEGNAGSSYGDMLLKEKTNPEDNIAPWLITKWKTDWGKEYTNKICEQMMPSDESSVVPRIDLSTKFTYSSDQNSDKVQQLLEALGEDSILLPHSSIRVGTNLKGGVKNWPGYNEGTWWVQDASSTLPALVLVSSLRDKYGDLSWLNIVDMCAAPGGKTSQLLSAGFASVTAVEANQRRSRRLIENLKRLGFVDDCEVVVQEGQTWYPTRDGKNAPVHGILLDVPCSATGTGARRPDVLRRSPVIKDLLQIQEKLANHCVDTILDVGGIMVYATCSLLKEESELQVEKLIARGKDKNEGRAVMKTLPIHPHEVPGYEGAIDGNGWLRVLPGVLEGHLMSTDGFFVARLVKVE
mmetsp:Transcript_27430/g.56777  ORF Transcript_27430/g.56777 Transcript_27430/m.56777 type:complete len:601 (+) Transcript_27430:278-2080(+)